MLARPHHTHSSFLKACRDCGYRLCYPCLPALADVIPENYKLFHAIDHSVENPHGSSVVAGRYWSGLFFAESLGWNNTHPTKSSNAVRSSAKRNA